MDTLLIEIGTEEIPAGYIAPALAALSSNLMQKLNYARITCGEVQTFGTPRRLAVMVAGVAEKQAAVTREVTGPPVRIAFDEHGNPTLAAEKFAQKVGIRVQDLTVSETPKGSYLAARITERGQSTRTVLSGMLPELILGLPFPKSMKWADLSISFARPIHSILALLGQRVVAFQVGNIRSGRHSFGHRFIHPARIKIQAPEAYIPLLQTASVIPDMEKRKTRIEKEVDHAAQRLNGRVIPDPELLDTVTNLVEFPAVASGRFDDKFLELPDAILITAMRKHQKYFAVAGQQGNLMPNFIAVNNTPARDMALVARGHERVLRARLEDARFFYTSDRKESMDTWVEKLKGVLFQARLGSMHDKILRVQKVAGFLADALEASPSEKESLLRAAWLAKADLVSQVVYEFPDLQGIMGRIYARLAGEPEAAAQAIEEHYRPTYSGGALPETLTGAMLAISDKIDSICGCFSIGLVPTGASDPYALRRQCIGIVQIMLRHALAFSLTDLIRQGLAPFPEKEGDGIDATAALVYDFFQSRIAHLLAEEGFSKDVIAAVVGVSIDHIPQVWQRVQALENLKRAPDFEPLAVAFKRVVNIIRQAEQNGAGISGTGLDPALFEHDSETALLSALEAVHARTRGLLATGDFDQALRLIATLHSPVDAFFDGVLVLAEDPRQRANRLALLKRIADLFAEIADFGKIST